MNSQDAAAGARLDPVAVLGDLPVPLWRSVVRALRRAVDRLPRADLPVGLRPFAGWTAESLSTPRPRRAVAEALATDGRLRERVGAAMDDPRPLDGATPRDGARLVKDYGEETAVVALVAQGRWDELAVLAAVAAERLASRQRTASDAGPDPHPDACAVRERRMAEELSLARAERDSQCRRADAAEARAGRAEEICSERDEEVASLRAHVVELQELATRTHREHAQRVARLQRKVADAQARARVDQGQVRRVVDELDRLTAVLRSALEPAPPGQAAPSPPQAPPIPRSTVAAQPGRPCRLPPGVDADGGPAVRALLQVPALEVVLDGYNVTKDARGRPQASLEVQRQWLIAHVRGVTARYGPRVTVVFDGSDHLPGSAPSPRGVRVVFSAGEETADERIGHIVESMEATVPVLVVSSDREVRAAAEVAGANVASSGAFLAGSGG